MAKRKLVTSKISREKNFRKVIDDGGNLFHYVKFSSLDIFSDVQFLLPIYRYGSIGEEGDYFGGNLSTGEN